MGTTKSKKGDGHIIFSVGKELPTEGSNFMCVPGVQKAQGFVFQWRESGFVVKNTKNLEMK
jgi:hypothetical protein